MEDLKNRLLRGKVLRDQAEALLAVAYTIDGLSSTPVVHTHEYGETVYFIWSNLSETELTPEVLAPVMEAKFEEDRGETLTIYDAMSLSELVGNNNSYVISPHETPVSPE